MPKPILRRHFLKTTGVATAALLGGPLLAACSPGGHALSAPTADPNFKPDLEVTLTATTAEAAILPGTATKVWTYRGEVVSGDPTSLMTIPNSYLGPILRLRRGQKVRITFANDLPGSEQESIIHWHGLQVPAAMDGHPRDAVGPGHTFVYEFEVTDRAGTYWFHPHPHGLTATQVNAGLAGLLIVSDDEGDATALPAGDQDVALVIQDRVFDADNQFVYGIDMMTAMMGFLGDTVLINGRAHESLGLATRAYRFRILNGSNARIYKLAWSDATPLIVLATDGGLLEAPIERSYVMLAPGERIELWVDFSGRKTGDEVKLVSQAFSGAENVGGGGMMGGHIMGGATYAPGVGAAQDLLTLRVERQEADTLSLPATLTPLARLDPTEAVNAAQPRIITITQQRMQWKLNGRGFEMDAVADDERVMAGTLELWDIVNDVNPGEMMDPLGMAHPFHIHGVQFQVIARTLRDDYPELAPGYASVNEGFIDTGWKDTVLVMPGETVRLLLRLPEQPGRFVYHCHNLEHADAGMMRNYEVQA
ncbi:MAG: multicopper oxidase domain-containing protein [Anaerolineales bacterium]|nr:multicopper oxidase domain-containing protein [Anaerolineales bacterium]